MMMYWQRMFLLVTLMAPFGWVHAQAAHHLAAFEADDSLPNQVGLTFWFDNAPENPQSQWLPMQSLLMLDFPDTNCKDFQITSFAAEKALDDMRWTAAGNRCRWSARIQHYQGHDLMQEQNQWHLRIDTDQATEQAMSEFIIQDFLFQSRHPQEGTLEVQYDPHRTRVDVEDEDRRLRIRFDRASISPSMLRNFEVAPLGTPVSTLQVARDGNDVIIDIILSEDAQHAVYQMDDKLYLEIKPNLVADTAEYEGEMISLNFQNIDVRAVLQLLADFSDFNIVASDSVSGNVTLRLKHVPWDQALDLILKIKGLDKRVDGNVMLVAPAAELAVQELNMMTSSQQLETLAPLRTELIAINFAKASDLANLFKQKETTILSDRGKVSVDERTNTLLVVETDEKLVKIKGLIAELDKPVRQVLIETRIVKANDDFEKALGVRFGASSLIKRGQKAAAGIAGNLDGSSAQAFGTETKDVSIDNRLAVSLPRSLSLSSGVSGSIGVTLARLPGDMVLDLELQALESEGLIEVVSTPRLVTANQKTAYIESGEEIPYNETTSSGAASIAFKKAVLRLEVTPQITPDKHIILDLLVNQDSRGQETAGVLAIDKQEMKTQALVSDGETIVLGGIYKQTRRKDVTKIPLLGDIPYLGRLFRNDRNLDQREELLIFVTPKIVDDEALASMKNPKRLIPELGDVREDD